MYATKISKYMKYFKGNLLCLPESNAGIQTEEGAEAFQEAIDFLNKQPTIEPLTTSKGLCRIAEDFIAIYQKSDTGELANKDMEEIINKYGSFSAIINLVVSDGDPSRGQRESLLSTEIQKVGVANGKHNVYRHCSAIITSTEFENTVDKDDKGLLTEKNQVKNENKKEESKKVGGIEKNNPVEKNKENEKDVKLKSEKKINMFKGVIDGIMAGNSDKAFDEMMNDPIFKMMCGEDEDDTESVEETSHS